MAEFAHLLSPRRIGTLELKNRLLQTAMGTNLANGDGTISEESIGFYEARAAGGTAMLIMGTMGVANPVGRLQVGQVSIADDSFIPGLRRLTDAVHAHDGRICAQLNHGGMTSIYDMAAGHPVLMPSLPQMGGPRSKRSLDDYMFPEEMTAPKPQLTGIPQFKEADAEDIAWIVKVFADGAARAVEAGYDAIELHAGHTYLINAFLSPAHNRRTDRYGGSAEGRAQLMKEVIEGIRARIGRDFPLQVKLNAEEYLFQPQGITLEDAKVSARIAEAAGADAITVSTSHNYAVTGALLSSWMPHVPNKLLPLAAAIRAAVNLPVITVGRVDPEAADQAIAAGQLDFLAQGRRQIADDAFANNLARGGKAAVRPCIFCYQCLSQSMMGEPLRCAVNADVGFETDNLLEPTKAPRKVVVVGGGPGGMEAARRLTLRGHRVTLLEASNQLGGTARMAAIAYAPNGDFVAWLKAQLAEREIDVRLNTRADAATIAALAPDVVVVATGAIRKAPPIPGKDFPHVHDGASLRALLLGESDGDAATRAPLGQRLAMGAARAVGIAGSPDLVRKASKLWMPVGDRVVIIGGELVGLELAEFLHERGRAITVVDDIAQFGRGLSPARRSVMLEAMPDEGIVLHEGASDITIGERSVSFVSANGEHRELPADSVIIAKGAEAQTGLFDDLRVAGIEAHMVGDCQGVGYILGAVRNAADVAARI
ncbi:MAG: FAD-dependent oxidoreductase [Sphingomonadales bacterium]|nr:FAD-dependent oxidoreductase [Sphingomonadales bacterium]